MTRGEIDFAIRRALNAFDKWNDVTGVIEKRSSYYYEMQGCIIDAVHCGVQAVLDIDELLPSEIYGDCVADSISSSAIEDANIFGEAMREYCFDCPPEEFGCYSCFEVNPEFMRVSISSKAGRMVIAAIVGDSRCEEFADDVIDRGKFYSNGSIHFGWYWDCDGSLAFIEGDRCVVSSDCKKDYDWHWQTVKSLENDVKTKP